MRIEHFFKKITLIKEKVSSRFIEFYSWRGQEGLLDQLSQVETQRWHVAGWSLWSLPAFSVLHQAAWHALKSPPVQSLQRASAVFLSNFIFLLRLNLTQKVCSPRGIGTLNKLLHNWQSGLLTLTLRCKTNGQLIGLV